MCTFLRTLPIRPVPEVRAVRRANHHRAQLVQQLPHGLVTLVAQLTLQLSRRYTLLRSRQQVHSHKPVHKWQLRAVHHRAASERSPVPAMLALILLLAPQPNHIVRAAMLTRHTLLVSPFPEPPPTGHFVRKILVKLVNLQVTFYFINAL